MATTLPMASAVRFHLSLNVADLHRSVAFYKTLFGSDPAKLRSDYAKFELDDPALVLSLEPSSRISGGVLNHLGFRLADSAALVAMQERLARAGIDSQREEGVECCYARQTKFWVHDPDDTLWEIYTLDADIEHRGAGQAPDKIQPSRPANGPSGNPTIWEHLLHQPIPARLPHADNSIDEVRLRGTFNVPVPADTQGRLAAEVKRVLKPGGRVFVHVLTAEAPLQRPPQLSGPAVVVQHVPLQSEPVRLLQQAGLERVRMLKFNAKPCFVQDGVAMRELQLEGWKASSGSDNGVAVLFKGPFRELIDDSGRVFPRGEWVQVTPAEAERLGGWAEAFTVRDRSPD